MIKQDAQGEFFTSNILHQLLLFLFFVLLFGLGSLYLGQDISWDLLNYHFYNGYAYTHHRFLQDVAPAMMQTYLNPYLDVLNYAIISIPNPKLAVFLLGMNSAIVGFFLYKTAVILFSYLPSPQQTVAAFLSVSIGMTGAGSVSLLGTTTNDVSIAMLIVVSFYCLLRALTQSGAYQARWVMAAAVLVGFAVGFKLTAATYVLGLLGGLIFSYHHNISCKKLVGLFLLFSLFGFTIVDGYWMKTLYQHFQNPFFPYYNNIFHSAFAPFVSFNLSPAQVTPHWRQYLFFPYYAAVASSTFYSERALQDSRMLVVLILPGIAALICLFQKYQVRRFVSLQPSAPANDNSQTAWRFVASYFCLSYVAWLLEFAVYRYLLPLELMTGMIILYFVYGIFRSPNLRRIFLAALLLILVMTTQYPNWGRMKIGQNYFSMHVPGLPPHSTVLIAAVPLAYTIPFFASDTRFIGMTFVGLGEDISSEPHLPQDKHRQILSEIMNELMKNPAKSSLYVLTIQRNGPATSLTIFQTIRNNKRSFSILKHFGITKDENKCAAFTTNMGDTLQLCPLRVANLSHHN